jgi:hypothetical protein
MKRILYLVFLLFSFSSLYADVNDNLITTPANGIRTVTENPTEGIDPNANGETYRREAIFSFILLEDSKRIHGMTPQQAKFVNVVNATKGSSNATNNTDNQTITVAGFCLIKEDLLIAKQPGSLKLDCETNIGGVSMFANLKSVNQLNSLMVDPVWIDYRGGRYKVARSFVTNEAQTSYNIATYVNDRKIAEVGLSSLSVASDEAKTASNDYLKALEEARKKEELAFVDVTSGNATSYSQPVQLTNIERPEVSDYLIGAGINILASTIKTTAELFKRDLPYLYEVIGGTKIYVDMQVIMKGEKIR